MELPHDIVAVLASLVEDTILLKVRVAWEGLHLLGQTRPMRANGSKRGAKTISMAGLFHSHCTRSIIGLAEVRRMASAEDKSSVSDSENAELLNLQDDEGWEEAEPEDESVKFICLFGQSQFSNIRSMLQHCKDKHNFDLARLKNKFGV